MDMSASMCLIDRQVDAMSCNTALEIPSEEIKERLFDPAVRRPYGIFEAATPRTRKSEVRQLIAMCARGRQIGLKAVASPTPFQAEPLPWSDFFVDGGGLWR